MTHDTAAPALPEPQSTVCITDTERGLSWSIWRTPGRPYYTADQMHAYAAECVTAATAALKAELAALRAALKQVK